MPYSLSQYTGNGATTTFAVTFPYVDRTHVTVMVAGAVASFQWVNDSLIAISPAPANGALVSIERSTSRGTRLVDFADGQNLTEADLDMSVTQTLYVAQEAFDQGSTAVAGAVAASAAAALSSANAAASSTSAAQGYSNAAAVSATNAFASASSASTSAAAAATKLAQSSNLTDVASRATALNNITAAGAATTGWVLTRDSGGNAVFTAPSIAAGALVQANNLNDLNSVSAARSNLGLGSLSTQAANSVTITGGTVAVATVDTTGLLNVGTSGAALSHRIRSLGTTVKFDGIPTDGSLTLDSLAMQVINAAAAVKPLVLQAAGGGVSIGTSVSPQGTDVMLVNGKATFADSVLIQGLIHTVGTGSGYNFGQRTGVTQDCQLYCDVGQIRMKCNNVDVFAITTASKAMLVNTITDDGVNKLQVAGGARYLYTAPGTGAVPRYNLDKFAETVWVDDYGAYGNYDPVTFAALDDAPAFLRAATALGPKGGTIRLNAGKRYYLDTILILPPKVTIAGSFTPGNAGGYPGEVAQSQYDTCGSAIAIRPGAYLVLSPNCGVKNVLVYRAGMAWPVHTTAAYSGDALVGNGDDVSITDSMILGFSTAFQMTGYGRPRIKNVGIDCLNGLYIVNAADVPYISEVHCWPFLNVNSFTVGTDLNRSGIGFHFDGQCDQMKLSRCFAFGYATGFQFNNVTEVTVDTCSVDGNHPTGVGFDVLGTSSAHFLNCSTFSQVFGMANSSSGFVNVVGGSYSQSGVGGSQGIKVNGPGDMQVNGAVFELVNFPFNINHASCKVAIDNCHFNALTTTFAFNASNPNVVIGENNQFTAGPTFSGTYPIPGVASAGTMAVPSTGKVFNVTGTTGITTINKAWPGRCITLSFAGALTLTNSGVGTNLHLNGNFTTQAGSQLTLMGIAVDRWVEVSRLF